MKKQYMFIMFILCFCVWAVVVDNLVLPKTERLKQDIGQYSRYRVKKWTSNDKLDFIEDELLIYVIVKNREQCYYMDHRNSFESYLKRLPAGTPVQMGHVNRFPKFWKRHLYDLRIGGISKMGYSPVQRIEKQRSIWKFTGIMGGVYLILVVLGLINKPQPR